MYFRLLTEKELDKIKDMAKECWYDCARQDPRVLVDTVMDLATKLGVHQDWWIGWVSDDPDVLEELTGFDPSVNASNPVPQAELLKMEGGS